MSRGDVFEPPLVYIRPRTFCARNLSVFTCRPPGNHTCEFYSRSINDAYCFLHWNCIFCVIKFVAKMVNKIDKCKIVAMANRNSFKHGKSTYQRLVKQPSVSQQYPTSS